MELNFVQTIAIWALPVIFAITLHEAAHGYVARHFGDPTAYLLGRVTLNPLKHIDPIGTVAVPLGLFFIGKLTGGMGFMFGWAKPVPVNFDQLRRPKQHMLWVAAAGPAMNLLMAIGWSLLIRFGATLDGNYFAVPMMLMGTAGLVINVSLMSLNLLPIPPLDGGRILVSLLPNPLADVVARLEPYGFMILLIMISTPLMGKILQPMISISLFTIVDLVGIDQRLLNALLNSL